MKFLILLVSFFLISLNCIDLFAQFQGDRGIRVPSSQTSAGQGGRSNSSGPMPGGISYSKFISNKLKSSTHAPEKWVSAVANTKLIEVLLKNNETNLEGQIEEILREQYGFANIQSVNCLNRSDVPLQIVADNDKRTLQNPKLCQSFVNVFNIVKKIDALFASSNLKGATKLKNLNIVIMSELNNAFYYPMLKTIFIPTKFYLGYALPSSSTADEISKELDATYIKVSKHPKFLESVIAHEYGHYLFDHNYSQSENAAINSNPFSCEGSEFISGVNELTADIVSLSITMDPKGVADALFHTGLVNTKTPSKGKPLAKVQNDKTLYFSTFRDFSNRDNRLEKVSQLVANGSMQFNMYISLFHNYLSPVRYHLWTYYLSDPAFVRNDRGLAVKKSLDVIMQAMVGIVKNKSQGEAIANKRCLSSRKVAGDNKVVINFLDEHLK